MTRPISALITVYNGERYIAQAIESALAQTYPNIEVIVVDDGSTDNTRTVVERYASVRYFRQENQGVAVARNRGIQLAKGEYVAFLDYDDLWEPEFLDRLAPVLERHPYAGMAYCGYRYIDGHGGLLPQFQNRVVLPDRLFEAIAVGNFLAVDAVLLRMTSAVEARGFDPTLRNCEDFDFWLRLLSASAGIGIPDILVLVRAHGRGKSAVSGAMAQGRLSVVNRHFGMEGVPVPAVTVASRSSEPGSMSESRLAIVQRHFGEPNAPGSEPPASLKKRAYAGAYFWSAIDYLQTEELEKVHAYLARAFSIDPGMVGRPDVFYELAQGGQPKGWRGGYEALDLEANAGALFDSLGRLFERAELPSALVSHRSLAHGNAHFALGMLAYGARDMKRARVHLLEAVRAHPAIVFKRQLATTFLKSLLGDRLVSLVHQQRERLSHAHSRPC